MELITHASRPGEEVFGLLTQFGALHSILDRGPIVFCRQPGVKGPLPCHHKNIHAIINFVHKNACIRQHWDPAYFVQAQMNWPSYILPRNNGTPQEVCGKFRARQPILFRQKFAESSRGNVTKLMLSMQLRPIIRFAKGGNEGKCLL